MATIQEIQAAAKLKREKNLTPAEAVEQVRTSATPITPPVTPPPQPINQQTVQGVNGETFQVAPVNAQGVTPQTAPTQPVAPTTPEPVKPTATPEKTTTVAGVDKAVDIKAQNEAQMALNAQKSQLAIQERKQAEADAKLASIPTDQKGITQSLISGMSVAPQNTQAYRNAVTVAEQFKKFNGMTDVQFLDNLKQGQIGSELDSLLSQNPNYAKAKAELAKAQKTASINRAVQVASNVIKGTENVTEDDLSNVEAKYNAPPGTNVEAYQQYVTQHEDVVRAGLQLKSLSNQISTVTKSYNDALTSLKQQYGDMPASALLTLMQSRTKDTRELLDSYINAKELAKGDFDMAMKMAEGSYEAYGKDLAQQQTIDAEQRAMKNSLALSQMEFDQKIAQQAQAMNDPTQAISTMVEEYKKLGIPFSRSTQQIIQDFQGSGQDLATYLSTLQGQIQSKPEYQAYKDKQTGTEWQSTSITRYNPSTGANESTPIFYRKKTSGGFEAVDLSGNPIDVSSIGGSGGTSTPGVNATGNIVPVTAGNKTVRLDQSGASGFENAINQLKSAGIDIVVGEGARDQTATIKSMAERYGIPFNASNPAETAQKLRSAGHQVADPGKSNHETGMAIDVYADSKFNPVTPEQEKILNANGWYSAGIPGDAGHFEYRGGGAKTTSYPPDKIKSFETFDGKSFPSDYKTPAQQKVYRDEYNAWRESQASNQIKTGQDIINIRVSDKASEGEKAALQYSSRALNAINDLPQYEDTFAKLPLKEQLFQQYAPDLLKSDNQKILEARKKDFITAILRKESGASIAPSEFANEEKKYFAQPGDSQAVIVVKQNARNFAIKSLLTGAGQDVNGRSINTLYNPPAIDTKTSEGESIADRLARLRKK